MAKDYISGLIGGPPKYDLVGPTVDDDVRRLIARYGAAAVKGATAKLTKAKRGRKALSDWAELIPSVDSDARVWLDGGDPFAARSNYAIAKEFADAHPGHDHASTMQRIERKLRRQPYGRRWYVIVRAMEMSGDGYPYASHLRALDELGRLDTHPVWKSVADRLRGNVADYRAKWGEPADELTTKQIEEGAIKALPSNGGLSGLIAKSLEGLSPLGKILAQAVDGDAAP